LLSLAPLVGAGSMGWASLSSRTTDRSLLRTLRQSLGRDQVARSIEGQEPLEVTGTLIGEPPTVVLSIEPASSTSSSETDAPVVFPGYLLPDDSFEEPAHEGS
jgi:hypothetical protein